MKIEFPIRHYRRDAIDHNLNSDHPLWQVLEPPVELFIQGSPEALKLLHSLPERGLAVVGTRNPQPKSVSLLKKWIRELEGSNLIIISGLARGIDAVAHAASLEAKLPTIAVLGAGLDLDYPRENTTLRNEILKAHGLIISEFPIKTPAHGHHFLRRNRLIAGWSKATWVIEAGLPSGALSTARWARDQDRTCFAVPCYPGDPTLVGNQILLDRDHALPFWGVHNLGAVWMELASHPLKADRDSTHKRISPLRRRVHFLTHQKGGAQVQELLDWALNQGWTPQRFYLDLQSTIEKNEVLDRQGTLISI